MIKSFRPPYMCNEYATVIDFHICTSPNVLLAHTVSKGIKVVFDNRGRCNLAVWASSRIHKIAGCACAGNTGNVFPAIDFKGNRQLAILACTRTIGDSPYHFVDQYHGNVCIYIQICLGPDSTWIYRLTSRGNAIMEIRSSYHCDMWHFCGESKHHPSKFVYGVQIDDLSTLEGYRSVPLGSKPLIGLTLNRICDAIRCQ